MPISFGVVRRFLLLFGFFVTLVACGGSDPVSDSGFDPAGDAVDQTATGDARSVSASEATTVPAIPTASPSDLSGDSPRVNDDVEPTPSAVAGALASEPSATAEVPSSDSGRGADFDAAIDRLVVDCLDDMDMACDVLLTMAVKENARQREIAESCGGRGKQDDGFCVDGVERQSALAPSFRDDSAAIAAIGDACGAGDMTACDFLFYRSGADSQWHKIGNTCSGRVVTAVPTCRDIFDEADTSSLTP